MKNESKKQYLLVYNEINYELDDDRYGGNDWEGYAFHIRFKIGTRDEIEKIMNAPKPNDNEALEDISGNIQILDVYELKKKSKISFV